MTESPRSVRWLVVTVRPTEGGGLDQLEIACRVCQAEETIPLDEARRWFGTATIAFRHGASCYVPDRLAKASAARWN